MNTIQRTFEIERGSIDLETGKFPMVLASEGEAADGHVLNIRGAHVPDKMPLQLSHASSPLQTLGSITHVHPGTKGDVRVLRGMGEIEMGGEGPQADIRRDLAFMISEGHISSVSLRAEGVKVIPRRELPKNHRAYVEPTEPDVLRRYGLYFDEFNALEGSIVAVGADRNAIIGRSKETEGAVQEFWRSLIPEEDEPGEEPEAQELDTSEIQDVRSLERFLSETLGVSRKEAKRLASIKTESTLPRDAETAQPSRDAKEEVPEPTMEEIREMVRAEFKDTMSEIHTEVADILSDALGKVRAQ